MDYPSQPASQTVGELIEHIDRTVDEMPKRVRQCARFTRQNMHLVAVSTVSEMSIASGVAPSVYMRFCQALGFSGYSEMQALFRARFTEFRPPYDERLANLRTAGDVAPKQILADFTEAGHLSLLSLANTVTSESLDRLASGLANARMIHLVGLRRAFAVVSNMAYLLDKLGRPTTLHFGAGMLSSIHAIGDDDALFAVTFAPFSTETVALAKATAERGIPVFGLTDSVDCPVNAYATEMLVARENEVAGFRAPTAAIAVTTALAVAVKALSQSA